MNEHAAGWIVVGGGRWGRTLAMMLGRSLPLNERIDIVTRHNRLEVERWLSTLPSEQHGRTGTMEYIDVALGNPLALAVVVANRPAQHCTTAARALAAGKHVLVEKPFTLDLDEARALVADAKRRNLVLAVGLEYLFATYLHRLRRLIGAAQIRSASIDWVDPVVEFRHGGQKRADLHTSILHDILPHVWSVLKVLSLSKPARPQTIDIRGSQVELGLSLDAIDVTVHMDRFAPRRRRQVALTLDDNRAVALDFTIEPGRPVIDGGILDECPDWKRSPSPVAAEILAFRQSILTGNQPAHAAALCLDSVRLATDAEKISSRQALRAC